MCVYIIYIYIHTVLLCTLSIYMFSKTIHLHVYTHESHNIRLPYKTHLYRRIVLYHAILCYRPSLFTSLPTKSTKFHVKFPKLKGVNVSHQVGFFSGNCTQKAATLMMLSSHHVRTCVFFCVSIVFWCFCFLYRG